MKPAFFEKLRHSIRLDDVRLVGGVVQDDRVLGARVVDPALERLAGDHGPGGVVRIAEIDQVDVPVGQRRLELVLGGAGQVHDASVAAALVGAAATPGDHVAVGVDGVNGIHERDHAVLREDLLEVRAVALAAVAHEDLVDGDLHAARAEVVGRDLGAQELVTDVGPVALEGLAPRHVVRRLVNRPHDGRGQRLGHVADAEIDQANVGMRVGVHLRPAPDLGEEIALIEVQVELVESGHGALPRGF